MCIYSSFSHVFACLPAFASSWTLLLLVTWQLGGLEHSNEPLLWTDWSLCLGLPLKAVANSDAREANWASNQIPCINTSCNTGLQANKWQLVLEVSDVFYFFLEMFSCWCSAVFQQKLSRYLYFREKARKLTKMVLLLIPASKHYQHMDDCILLLLHCKQVWECS